MYCYRFGKQIKAYRINLLMGIKQKTRNHKRRRKNNHHKRGAAARAAMMISMAMANSSTFADVAHCFRALSHYMTVSITWLYALYVNKRTKDSLLHTHSHIHSIYCLWYIGNNNKKFVRLLLWLPLLYFLSSSSSDCLRYFRVHFFFFISCLR